MRVVGGVLGRGVRWGGGRAEWREWPAEVPRLSGRRAGHRHWGSPAHSGSGQCHLASFPYSTRLLLAAAGPGGEETGGSRVELGAAGGARRAGGRRGRSQGGGRPHETLNPGHRTLTSKQESSGREEKSGRIFFKYQDLTMK